MTRKFRIVQLTFTDSYWAQEFDGREWLTISPPCETPEEAEEAVKKHLRGPVIVKEFDYEEAPAVAGASR